MGKRPDRNHASAFNAMMVLEALSGEQIKLSQRYQAHSNQVTNWKKQLLVSVIAFHVLTFLLPANSSAQSAKHLAWTELLRGQAIAIIRHAIAPGFGDPPQFSIGDCSTQRNLSKKGRAQARRIGELFRSKGVKGASVFSSQWCRCLETAKLINLGDVKELPSLNSFFRDISTEDAQTLEIRNFIRTLPAGSPTILVTHQVNITALTGIFPSSGEIIIFRLTLGGQATVLGRFIP